MHKVRLVSGLMLLFGAACGGDVAGPESGAIPHPSLNPSWTWQTPLPHGNAYGSIEALGGGRAITLTRSEALETTDGDDTWARYDNIYY